MKDQILIKILDEFYILINSIKLLILQNVNCSYT